MAHNWNPAQYLAFGGHRLRPAIDLLGRVGEIPVPKGEVVDLGCGTGTSTRILAARWPQARVCGVDNSQEMLARADNEPGGGGIRWVRADLNVWRPERPPHLIFSNAALHWLDDHATLFPHLLSLVAPGGTLAVQMPHNHGAATHTLMTEVANAGPWAARLQPFLRPSPVADPAFYHDVLAQPAATLDLWETEYLHVLEGVDAVTEWTKGSALRPLLEALDEPERSTFEAEYRTRIRQAYPHREDGTTLMPFRRLFIVATAPD